MGDNAVHTGGDVGLCLKSWDQLVRRLKQKMPGVMDESLRQGYKGLTGWTTGASSVAG